jgi:hypothetical protein
MNPVDVLPSDAQWHALTTVPAKRHAYAEDLYFRETWAEWLALCPADPVTELASVALLCAKPDAVVGRRLARMLAYAMSRGFAPFGAAEFELTRHSMREVWRHDWHVYPADRLPYCTTWYTSTATLAFLLRDERPEQGLPASVRLAHLKGNAIAAKRKPGELRSKLHPPNSVLNFVHVPDEPADIVRELGILWDRRERFAMLRRIRDGRMNDGTHEAADAITRLERRYPAHDLDFEASLSRMVASGALPAEEGERLRECARQRVTLSWDELCALADPEGSGVDRWDFISVASELIPLERPGTSGLIPGTSPQAWTTRGSYCARAADPPQRSASNGRVRRR